MYTLPIWVVVSNWTLYCFVITLYTIFLLFFIIIAKKTHYESGVRLYRETVTHPELGADLDFLWKMWVLIFLFFFFTLCKVFIIQSLPPEGRSHSLLCGCDWQLEYRKTQVQNYGASFSKEKSSWDLLQRTWNRGCFYTVSAAFQKCKQQNTVTEQNSSASFLVKFGIK